jgi:hypothetical protein
VRSSIFWGFVNSFLRSRNNQISISGLERFSVSFISRFEAIPIGSAEAIFVHKAYLTCKAPVDSPNRLAHR